MGGCPRPLSPPALHTLSLWEPIRVSLGHPARGAQGPGLALSKHSLGPSLSPAKFLWPIVSVCLYLSLPTRTPSATPDSPDKIPLSFEPREGHFHPGLLPRAPPASSRLWRYNPQFPRAHPGWGRTGDAATRSTVSPAELPPPDHQRLGEASRSSPLWPASQQPVQRHLWTSQGASLLSPAHTLA